MAKQKKSDIITYNGLKHGDTVTLLCDIEVDELDPKRGGWIKKTVSSGTKVYFLSRAKVSGQPKTIWFALTNPVGMKNGAIYQTGNYGVMSGASYSIDQKPGVITPSKTPAVDVSKLTPNQEVTIIGNKGGHYIPKRTKVELVTVSPPAKAFTVRYEGRLRIVDKTDFTIAPEKPAKAKKTKKVAKEV